MGSNQTSGRIFGWALRGTVALVATAGLGVAAGAGVAGAGSDPSTFCSDLTFSVPRFVTPVNAPTNTQLLAQAKSVRATGVALVAVSAESPNSQAQKYLARAGTKLQSAASNYAKAVTTKGSARTKLLKGAAASLEQLSKNMQLALPIEQSVCRDFGVAGRAAVSVAGKAASIARSAKRAVDTADVRAAVSAAAHTKVPVRSWSPVAHSGSGVVLQVRMQLVVHGVTYSHCAVFLSKIGSDPQMVPCRR